LRLPLSLLLLLLLLNTWPRYTKLYRPDLCACPTALPSVSLSIHFDLLCFALLYPKRSLTIHDDAAAAANGFAFGLLA